MEEWYQKKHQALDAYHNNKSLEALELFTKLLSITKDQNRQIDLKIWQASCYRKIGNFKNALNIIKVLEENPQILSPELKTRIQYVRADIAADMFDFQQAIDIYQSLVNESKSYIDLSYLEQRVDELIIDFEYYKKHGTLDQWKNKIIRRLKRAVKALLN